MKLASTAFVLVALLNSTLAAEPKVSNDLTAYKEALKRGALGCEPFVSLAKKSDFPLQELAALRAQLACDRKIDFAIENIKLPYAVKLKTDALIKRALLDNNNELYVSLILQKSPQEKRQADRLKLLETALKEELSPEQKKKIQTEMSRIAPRLREKPPVEEWHDVASDLINNREFKKGRELLKKLVAVKNLTTEKQKKARSLMRNSYKIEQNKLAHIQEAQDYYQWLLKKNDSKAAFDAGVVLVRALWTEGLRSQAEKTMLEIEKKLTGKTSVYEIFYLRGRMHEEDRNFKLAIAEYDKSLSKGAEKSALGFKVEFAKAWVQFQQDLFAEAATSFEKASEIAIEVSDQAKSSFWRARSLARAKQPEESQLTLKKVIELDPLGFYGLIAHRELGLNLPAMGENLKVDTASGLESLSPKSARKLSTEEKQLIQDLAFVEEKTLLESYLNGLATDSNWIWDSAEGVEFLRAYAKAGLYLPLFAMLAKIPAQDRQEMLASHPEILFPLEYLSSIEKAASTEGISPELMLAIIRQESAFDPFARSQVDALGLMQIMPSVGKEISGQLKTKIDSHDDLYEPTINLNIGARLLKNSFAKYKNNFVLTVASYNANDRAIRRWIKTRFHEDPLEFIEEIPYEETRAYVKLVIRNYVFYKRLKMRQTALAFPTECLPNLSEFKNSTEPDTISN